MFLVRAGRDGGYGSVIIPPARDAEERTVSRPSFRTRMATVEEVEQAQAEQLSAMPNDVQVCCFLPVYVSGLIDKHIAITKALSFVLQAM